MDLPFNSVTARSASDGVETSTNAYPTGRVVRGLTGIEVVSLHQSKVSIVHGSGVECSKQAKPKVEGQRSTIQQETILNIPPKFELGCLGI